MDSHPTWSCMKSNMSPISILIQKITTPKIEKKKKLLNKMKRTKNISRLMGFSFLRESVDNLK